MLPRLGDAKRQRGPGAGRTGATSQEDKLISDDRQTGWTGADVPPQGGQADGGRPPQEPAPHSMAVPPPVVPQPDGRAGAATGAPAPPAPPVRPLSDGGPRTAAPAARPVAAGPSAAEDPGPRRPGLQDADAGWGWGLSLAGLAVGFGPEMLLYVAALAGGTSNSTSAEVTTGTAVALVVTSLVVYGWQTLTAWYFSIRWSHGTLASWGFRRPNRAYFWTIPVALLTVYVVSILHDMFVHPRPQDIVGEFPHTTAGVVLFIVLAVVMAPLFEEVFFRGFLFRGFAGAWGWGAGAVVSAAVFGLAHLQLDVFVPLFTLGLLLAWVYKRTGSLWTSISLHALFNALSVLAWVFTR